MAAFAAGGDGDSAQAGAEFHDGDEAVAAGPIVFRRARIAFGREGREGAPAAGGEGDGDAGVLVVEGRGDVVGEALEAVDLAPGRAPGAEVRRQPVGHRGQGRQLLAGRAGQDVGEALLARPEFRVLAPEFVAPQHGQGGGDRVRRPPSVPGAQDRDLVARFGLQRVGGVEPVPRPPPAAGSGRRRRAGRDRTPRRAAFPGTGRGGTAAGGWRGRRDSSGRRCPCSAGSPTGADCPVPPPTTAHCWCSSPSRCPGSPRGAARRGRAAPSSRCRGSSRPRRRCSRTGRRAGA